MTVTWSRRVLASLASAAAVALLAHVASLVAFFVANQLQPMIFGVANSFFLLTTLFTFLLLFIAGLAGGMRSWRWALPVGIVVGIVGPIVSVLISTMQQGAPITGETFGLIVATLSNTNALYALSVVIATPTLGRAISRGIVGYHEAPRAAERRVALVRLPGKALADGIRSDEDAVIDVDRADEQWDAYAAAFEDNGWTTREATFTDEYADSVFIEDTVVLFDELAVITRPALEARRGETAGVEETVRALGGFDVETIEEPGTLEGGDVLIVGDTVYVGRSERTNAEGIKQLRRLVAPYGYAVVGVPVSSALHLKSAVTALPDGTFIGDASSIDEPTLFPGFIAAREPQGASVVVLDDDTLMIAESAPKTAALLEDLGYEVVTVDVSEFEKLDGCVTCLSVRVR